MAKIVVGMSGGVDSAVTAYLLKQAGHEVIGVTLRTWIAADGQESRCCEIDDARRAAWELGIQYYVVNCIREFEKGVTEPFVREYIRGHTPNPCVECNRSIKWEYMLRFAKTMNADLVATGHYASVLRMENGRYTVKKARHAEKDQTYMLYKLTQEQLASTIMPLGELSKEEVRRIAEFTGLAVAKKPDSQELCFITKGKYSDYVEEHAQEPVPGEGDFVDEEGNILGRHKGIIHYTPGQRKGLNLAMGHPVYVKKVDVVNNEVVVCEEPSLYAEELVCSEMNYLGISGLGPGEALNADVKIRYHHPAQEAEVRALDNGRVRVHFSRPVRAPAPGQSAVFYDNDGCVLGGGIISEVIFGQDESADK